MYVLRNPGAVCTCGVVEYCTSENVKACSHLTFAVASPSKLNMVSIAIQMQMPIIVVNPFSAFLFVSPSMQC